MFTSECWTNNYPNTIALPLSKPVSDHTPCCISIGTHIPKSPIFRFENLCLEIPSFYEVVNSIWNQPTQEQDSAKNITAKFKRLRKGIKTWARKLSNLSGIIRATNEVILFWDTIEEMRPLSEMEINGRDLLKEHLLKILSCQKIYWR